MTLDIETLISNEFYKDKPQFFFENNKSNLSFIGFGCIDSIEIYNDSNLGIIQSQIENKLDSIINRTRKGGAEIVKLLEWVLHFMHQRLRELKWPKLILKI